MQKIAVFFVGNEKMTTFAVRNERIDLNQEKKSASRARTL